MKCPHGMYSPEACAHCRRTARADWFIGDTAGMRGDVMEQLDRWELAGRLFVPVAHDGRANAVRIVRCSNHGVDCKNCLYTGQREVADFEDLDDPASLMYIFRGKLVDWADYKEMRPKRELSQEEEDDDHPQYSGGGTSAGAQSLDSDAEAKKLIPKVLAFGKDKWDQAEVKKKWVIIGGGFTLWKQSVFMLNAYLGGIPAKPRPPQLEELYQYVSQWAGQMGLPRPPRPCELKFSAPRRQNRWKLGITGKRTEFPWDESSTARIKEKLIFGLRLEGSRAEAEEYAEHLISRMREYCGPEEAERRFDRRLSEISQERSFEKTVMLLESFPGMSKHEWQARKLHWQGKTYREIGEEMGLSHTRAGQLVESAKLKFSDLLREHGGRFGARAFARALLGAEPDLTSVRVQTEVQHPEEGAWSALGRQKEGSFYGPAIDDREHDTGEPTSEGGETADNEFPDASGNE